jgi:DNA-binding transcriptional regulator GbsR (MarR family)
MNIRALIDWGLIYKELRPGIRREYFQAEKDMWAVTKKIIRERKKREIDPLVEMLDEMKDDEVETGTSPDDLQNFKKIVKDLMEINRRTDLLYNLFQTIDQTGLFSISDEIVNIKGKK